jgi:hypothetical protein
MSVARAEDAARDIRIMLRQGKSADYIRSVFGWTSDGLVRFCRAHEIALPTPPGGARRRDPADVRNVTIGFSTTRALADALTREAARRGTTKSPILHTIVAAVHARGLWSEILGSAGRTEEAS